jgi:hypothetical protein
VFYLRERATHSLAERLSRERAQLLLEDSQLLVIQRLAVAAAYRDDDTGQHTRRLARPPCERVLRPLEAVSRDSNEPLISLKLEPEISQI